MSGAVIRHEFAHRCRSLVATYRELLHDSLLEIVEAASASAPELDDKIDGLLTVLSRIQRQAGETAVDLALLRGRWEGAKLVGRGER